MYFGVYEMNSCDNLASNLEKFREKVKEIKSEDEVIKEVL